LTDFTVHMLLTMPPPLPRQNVIIPAINHDNELKNLGHKKVVPKAISDEKLPVSFNHEE
jgi:hypothetical protein